VSTTPARPHDRSPPGAGGGGRGRAPGGGGGGGGNGVPGGGGGGAAGERTSSPGRMQITRVTRSTENDIRCWDGEIVR